MARLTMSKGMSEIGGKGEKIGGKGRLGTMSAGEQRRIVVKGAESRYRKTKK
jgi:hypothetical protein